MIRDYSKNGNGFMINQDVKSILKYGTRVSGKIDISFVIPTYKRFDYLEEALDSIFSQKRSKLNWEVIIVDNDQSDIQNSQKGEILKKYDVNKISYYQNEKNIGMFNNWNRCIELAQADWIAMLHDDDCLVEDYLIKVERFFPQVLKDENVAYIKAKVEAFGCKSKAKHNELVVKRKKAINQYRKVDLEWLGLHISRLGAPTCGTLLNKELIMRAGGYREDFYPSGDSWLPVHLVLDCNYKVFMSNEILGRYRREVNASYTRYVIFEMIRVSAQYFSEYYPTWGQISKWIDKLFHEELAYELQLIADRGIDLCEEINDKDEAHKSISQMLGMPQRHLVKFVVYKTIKKCYRFIKG